MKKHTIDIEAVASAIIQNDLDAIEYWWFEKYPQFEHMGEEIGFEIKKILNPIREKLLKRCEGVNLFK